MTAAPCVCVCVSVYHQGSAQDLNFFLAKFMCQSKAYQSRKARHFRSVHSCQKPSKEILFVVMEAKF